MSNYRNTYNPENFDHSWSVAMKYVQPNTTVLEVGCGNGNFAEAIRELKGCTVDGIEPDTGDAAQAREKVRNLFHSTIEGALPKLKKEYDQIVFLDVIEHLYDPINVLHDLKKYLKKNGTILFSIPNMGHTSARLMVMSGKVNYARTGLFDETHLHFYTNEEIQRVFTEAGYEIAKLDGTVVEYTKEMVQGELKKMGVERPGKALVELLRSSNGSIYQYIGIARVASAQKKPKQLPNVSPNAESVVKEKYEKEIAQLKNELKLIRESRSYRYTKAARQFRNALRKK